MLSLKEKLKRRGPADESESIEKGQHEEVDMREIDDFFESFEKSTSGAAKESLATQNKDGGHHRGPAKGANKTTPTRSVKGAKKTDPEPGVYAKGEEDGDMEKGETCPDCGKAMSACKCMYKVGQPEVKKALPSGVYYETPLVQYVNTGLDELLAKSIAEGKLGYGGLVNKPMDGNNSPTRNLRNERGH